MVKQRTALLYGVMVAVLVTPSLAFAEDAPALDPSFLDKILKPEQLLSILAILATAVIGSRLSGAFLDGLGERFTARRLLLKKLASLTRFLVYIVAATFIVFGVVDPDKDTLLAMSATLALTIGLALKDLASSIIAGVIILLDSPFQVGDRVQYDSTYGEVVEIGLRTVKINTLDDNLVSIPNNKFLTDVVASSNAGELDMMVVIDFFIGLSDDHNLATRLVFEATASSRFVFLKKPITVLIEDKVIGGVYATRVRSKFYVADTRYETAIRSDITTRVKRAFQEHCITPPFSIHNIRRLPDEETRT